MAAKRKASAMLHKVKFIERESVEGGRGGEGQSFLLHS